MPTTVMIPLVLLTLGVALIGLGSYGFIKTYTIPNPDEYLLRTGGKAAVVSKGKGLLVIPFLHEAARISSHVVPIRAHLSCAKTSDGLHVYLDGNVLVQVDPDRPEIAVFAFGGVETRDLNNIVQKRFGDLIEESLRATVIRMTGPDCERNAVEIAEIACGLVRDDLYRTGLIIVSASLLCEHPYDDAAEPGPEPVQLHQTQS